jgi:hypothetical protein
MLMGGMAYAQTQSVSGTVANPDGSPFTGTFLISLTKSSVVDTCTTPPSIVPMPGVTVHVTGGVFPATVLLPTSCLQPRLPYYVQVTDSLHRPVYSDNWYIPQTTSGTVSIGTLGDVQMASGITVSVPLAIISNPVGNQTITQPGGTSLTVNNLVVTGSFSVTGTFSAGTVSATTVSASTSVVTPLVTATTVTASGTVQGSTINATSGITVGGVALSAAMLSDGVSGTGAICKVFGSLCAFSGALYYQTVEAVGSAMPQQSALDFISSWFTVTDSVSPSRTVIGLNTTGAESKLVTAATAGAPGTLAVWDSAGGLTSGASSSPTMNVATGHVPAMIYTAPSNAWLTVIVTGSLSSGVGHAASWKAVVNGSIVDINGVTNSSGAASVTFEVPPSGTYIVTTGGVAPGDTNSLTLTNWVEYTHLL